MAGRAVISEALSRRAATCAVTADDLCRLALEQWAADCPEAALAAAWAAYDEQPDDCQVKALLARLLARYPGHLGSERTAPLLRLLADPQVNPDEISTAGWLLARRDDGRWQEVRGDADCAALAADLDVVPLILTLLQEAPVFDRVAERALTRLRRWLLVSGAWQRYTRLVDALRAQAALNGGAWPFDETEGRLLDDAAGSLIAAAYLPTPDRAILPPRTDDSGSVAEAMRRQYHDWPFPVWRRVTVGRAARLADDISKLDPEGPDSIPADASILVAGCGTGREAASVALRYPEARVTAIDLSETSLGYARRQCSLVGAPDIRFVRLDLHRIAELGEQFDAIYCSGVLHHLADPERGWGALEAALKPGGVMKIMVYSRIARFLVLAARSLIGDLMAEPVSDDLLRRVRQRIIEHSDFAPARLVMNTQDFSTLVGTHDALLHPHEDPFDVPRISRALDRLGLRLIAFLPPSVDAAARYDAQYPHDPLHRDMAAWARFEKSELPRYAGLYTFACRKPLRDDRRR